MVEVRPLRRDDWPAVAAIFAEGIATGVRDLRDGRCRAGRSGTRRTCPSTGFVAELDGDVAGWVALVPYSRRAVYRGVGEESVYVAERARGRGVGRALLAARRSRAPAPAGSGRCRPESSPRTRRASPCISALGFREVGVRERIGRLDGAWRDVVLLELRL